MSENANKDARFEHPAHQNPAPVRQRSAQGNNTKRAVSKLTGKLLVRRVLDRLAPWWRWQYPGKQKVWVAVTPGYSLGTIKAWLLAKRHPSAAALDHWAALLEARIAGDSAVAAECRAEAERLRAREWEPQGFFKRRLDRLKGR